MDLDETHKEDAIRLVDDELESFPPDRDYLEYLKFDLKCRRFSTKIIEDEHTRLDAIKPELNSSHDHDSTANNSRSQTSSPQKEVSMDLNGADLQFWSDKLNKLRIKLEYKVRQIINLNILETHQMTIWNQYIAHTNSLNLQLESEIEHLNKEIQNIHTIQAAQQTELAKSLRLINEEWSN